MTDCSISSVKDSFTDQREQPPHSLLVLTTMDEDLTLTICKQAHFLVLICCRELHMAVWLVPPRSIRHTSGPPVNIFSWPSFQHLSLSLLSLCPNMSNMQWNQFVNWKACAVFHYVSLGNIWVSLDNTQVWKMMQLNRCDSQVYRFSEKKIHRYYLKSSLSAAQILIYILVFFSE